MAADHAERVLLLAAVNRPIVVILLLKAPGRELTAVSSGEPGSSGSPEIAWINGLSADFTASRPRQPTCTRDVTGLSHDNRITAT